MGKNVIEMKDVWKIYSMGESEVQALRGISFSVEEGEFVSIMGPSGSGKSTCMNMIGCLDRPTSGDVCINGRLIAEMNETELAKLRNETVGFVFQQYHLLSSMTVLENVMLPLRYKGVPYSERKRLAETALEKSWAIRATKPPSPRTLWRTKTASCYRKGNCYQTSNHFGRRANWSFGLRNWKSCFKSLLRH